MFRATFNLVKRTTIIFRTPKDSLSINSLASNNCFSNRNVFQNGVNFLFKMVNRILSKKAQNFLQFGPYDFVQISLECSPNTYQ